LPVQPDALWSFWSLEPFVILPLLVGHWIYGRGVLRLWAKAGWGRSISRSNVAAFAAGEFVLGIALISPLDALGETLLSAHMAQHALLVIVAPPLLIAGRPGLAALFAMPEKLRKPVGTSRPARRMIASTQSLTQPLPASLVHALTIWAWHVPLFFEAALIGPLVHWLEHVTFLGTSILLWRVMTDTTRPGSAIVAALTTLMHTGMLGASTKDGPRCGDYRCLRISSSPGRSCGSRCAQDTSASEYSVV